MLADAELQQPLKCRQQFNGQYTNSPELPQEAAFEVKIKLSF